MITTNNKKVLLGLSGGVDSAASCLVLKDKGFDVTGYYFDILGDKKDYEAVERLASQLDIDLIYEDVSSEFRAVVVENFIEEYRNGRTPNPCIICNPNVKFKKLIENADKLGIEYIATGHYAKVKEHSGHYYIERSDNYEKDQSYMLYRLPENVIKRIIFPLGEFSSKDEVRLIAKEKSLYNAEKKDSQEICFTDNYKNFLTSNGLIKKKGKFVDLKGNVLGEHEGIINYTIGQRKGLGIALGSPAFVVGIDSESNTVIIGDDDDLKSKLVRSVNNIIINEEMLFSDDVYAKIRYSQSYSMCKVKKDNDELIAEFNDFQRAPTRGQSIVFYKDGLVIGGGFIK